MAPIAVNVKKGLKMSTEQTNLSRNMSSQKYRYIYLGVGLAYIPQNKNTLKFEKSSASLKKKEN